MLVLSLLHVKWTVAADRIVSLLANDDEPSSNNVPACKFYFCFSLLAIQIILRCSFVLRGEHNMQDYGFLFGLVTTLWRPFSNPGEPLPRVSVTVVTVIPLCRKGPKYTAACRAILHRFEGRQHLQTRVWKDMEMNTMCKQQHHSGGDTLLCHI